MDSPAVHKPWLLWGFNAMLLLLLLPLFIPFSPVMPGLTIDASWALALNQAVSQGLIFGRDIVFTLGPYSAIYTKAYHPDTAYLMYGGCLYLALSYGLLLMVLTSGIAWRWRCALALLFLMMIYSRDALLLSYPLLLGLAVFKYPAPPRSLLALATAPLGLLILVKGTLLLFTLLVVLSTSLYLFLKKQHKTLLTLWIGLLLALAAFWCLANQPLAHLPMYLGQSIELAMGYSEAMASPGNGWEVFAFLVAAMVLIALIARQPDLKRIDKVFLTALFTLFLFCAFKAGFVRHFGHSLIAATAILMAAFLLPTVIQSTRLLPMMLLAVLTWFYILTGFTPYSPLTYLRVTCSNVLSALKMDTADRHWRERDFYLLKDYLANLVKFPPLPGKSDIYSFEQNFLIASGAQWSPRPVFQSYSVFSEAMALKNANHLAEKGPDTIVFKIEPLDERLPSLEDGASWPGLLTAYYPAYLVKDFLILKKQRQPAKPLPFTATETHTLGETITLPSDKPVFAAIDIKTNWLGHLLTWLYKPSALAIELELTNGHKKHYRLIAGMAKSGFLLSPLIENNKEFALLFGRDPVLSAKRVKSLRIIAKDNGLQWQKHYLLHYRAL
ncbi:hypothetical protein [Legionella taurinensis]|uniref:Transmembrane protein n=1 Tax=Legionella taurinensis TaxID=70611 RepID=A0A3A5LGL7_9GAMM|nr:hypothetical protein [Legionella taurinensis]RJT48775.1 hypothetical protein D6J04_03340 [Legionella taurinensis]RJT69765.1 hypothetical protein D6J03_01145 [Legionella taurinensis]STY24867.1 transmembrane protein [Legionella taurinensis]